MSLDDARGLCVTLSEQFQLNDERSTLDNLQKLLHEKTAAQQRQRNQLQAMLKSWFLERISSDDTHSPSLLLLLLLPLHLLLMTVDVSRQAQVSAASLEQSSKMLNDQQHTEAVGMLEREQWTLQREVEESEQQTLRLQQQFQQFQQELTRYHHEESQPDLDELGYVPCCRYC